MANLEFYQAILVLSGLVSLNAIAGFFFLPVDINEVQKGNNSKQKRVLKIKDHRKGIYHLSQPQSEEVVPVAGAPYADNFYRTAGYLYMYRLHNKEYEDTVPGQSMFYAPSVASHLDAVSQAEAEELKSKDASSVISTDHFISAMALSHGQNIADLININEESSQQLFTLLRSPSVLLYLLYAFTNSFSAVAFSSLVGDYTKHNLQFTNDEFSIGITIVGATSLVSALCYMVFTHFFSFSSTFLQIFNTICKGAAYLGLLAISKPIEFNLLMGFYGFTKAFGNMYACCMEIGSPENAVLMYMLQLTIDGIAGISVPFLATYLQVDVDSRAGFYLAGAVILTGALCFLPVSLRSFCTPKVYKPDQFEISTSDVEEELLEEI